MEFTLGTTRVAIPLSLTVTQTITLYVSEQNMFLELLKQFETNISLLIGFNDKVKQGAIFNLKYSEHFISCHIQLSSSCDFEFSYDDILDCINLEQLLTLQCKITNAILKVNCNTTLESKWWTLLLGYLNWESPLRRLKWKKSRLKTEIMMRNAIDYVQLICLALCQQEGEWHSFCCVRLYHPQLLCLIWDFCYDRANFGY